MLALGMGRGLSFFWSPNFDSKPKKLGENEEPFEKLSKRKKKKEKCKTMQALQRSLSEAQKTGAEEDTLIEMIREHKASCSKCKPKGY